MRVVLKVLVISIAVDSIKDSLLDSKLGMHNSGDWSDTVSGTRGVADNSKAVGAISRSREKVLMVNPNDGGRSIASFGWSRDDD